MYRNDNGMQAFLIVVCQGFGSCLLEQVKKVFVGFVVLATIYWCTHSMI